MGEANLRVARGEVDLAVQMCMEIIRQEVFKIYTIETRLFGEIVTRISEQIPDNTENVHDPQNTRLVKVVVVSGLSECFAPVEILERERKQTLLRF